MRAWECRKTEKKKQAIEKGKDNSEITRLTLKFYLASNLRSQHGMTAAPRYAVGFVVMRFRHTRVLGSVVAVLSLRVDKSLV